MNRTTIEWTHWSVTPLKLLLPDGSHVNFCIKCSEGCKFCYAESNVRRWWKKKWGKFPGYTKALLKIGKPVLIEEDLQQVLKLDRKIAEGKADPEINKVFWNDMTDEFGGFWPEHFIDQMMAVRALTPNLIHQVLTKRAGGMAEYSRGCDGGAHIHTARPRIVNRMAQFASGSISPPVFPLPNLWLGTSIENQKAADERIPHLLKCPAAIKFLSVEPLLGPVDLRHIHEDLNIDCLYGWNPNVGPEGMNCDRVDWVIVGGESGSEARPMHPDWARSIRDQCAAAGVPFFFKQWGTYNPYRECDGTKDVMVAEDGAVAPLLGMRAKEINSRAANGAHPMAYSGKHAAGRLLDGREYSEFPRIPEGVPA